MASPKRPRNLFFGLAIVFGLAFTLTACAYGVVMVRAIRPPGLPQPGQPGFGLTDLLNRRGATILIAELAGLALWTVGAIWLDHTRDRREFAARERATAIGATTERNKKD